MQTFRARRRDWRGGRRFICASFTKLSAREKRVCRRQRLWFLRVARGGAILPIATKFHGAFCTERDATGFSRRLHSGVGASDERCPARKARRGCKLYLPVAMKFHGAFCTEHGATGFSRRLHSGVGRATNAARRVKPLRFANFSRAAARLARQAELHPRQFHQFPARRERVCRRQGLWLSRVARGGLSCRLPRSFTARFARSAAQRGSPIDCAAEWVRAKPRFAGKGNAQAQSVFGKGKNLQWRGIFRRFQRRTRRLRGAKSRICSAIMAQKTLKLHFRRVSNTLQHGLEREAPNGGGPKRRWDPGFGAAQPSRLVMKELGGTDLVNQVFPPMTLPLPTVTSPPRMVAPA